MKRRGRGIKHDRGGSDDDKVYVACLPTTTPAAIPTSIQKNCARCSEPIWVSPATLSSVPRKPLPPQFICLDCAMKDQNFESAIQPPTPEQMEELKDYFEQNPQEGQP